jgi:predicted nucleotidyltransferase
VLDRIRGVLEAEPDIVYALVFGSRARGRSRRDSDVDVAIELRPEAARDFHAVGRLAARLESAVSVPVDVVLLDEAPPRALDWHRLHGTAASDLGDVEASCAALATRAT